MACDLQVIELGGSSGTTCTVCCINASRGIISSWNVGDSFSLLVHDNGYMELGTSHRLDDSESERERVRACGGTISQIMNHAGAPVGPLRAFPGGLAVVRCLGDADCSQYVATEAHSVPRSRVRSVPSAPTVPTHCTMRAPCTVFIAGM